MSKQGNIISYFHTITFMEVVVQIHCDSPWHAVWCIIIRFHVTPSIDLSINTVEFHLHCFGPSEENKNKITVLVITF